MTNPKGFASVTSENFDVKSAIGGVRGAIESTIPGVVFVIAYIITKELKPPLIAALAVSVVFVIIRLLQRTQLTQAFSGVIGVVIGVIWASRSGNVGNYFAIGFWTNAIYGSAFLLSMLLRFPLIGFAVEFFKNGKIDSTWRQDRALFKRYTWATSIWAALFGLRLVVQLPLYFSDQITLLGTARLAMGLPLTVIALWFTWLLVRQPKASQELSDELDAQQ